MKCQSGNSLLVHEELSGRDAGDFTKGENLCVDLDKFMNILQNPGGFHLGIAEISLRVIGLSWGIILRNSGSSGLQVTGTQIYLCSNFNH